MPPVTVITSLWQTPQAWTLISTSWRPGVGISRSTSSNGALACGTIIARIVGMASAGVPPRVMGIGAIPATEKLMARTGLAIADFDVVELNEAFASQALVCLRALGLPDDAEHVNPNGGAIAYGHPLGMSGARLAADVALELARRGGRYGLATMCVGVGQGVALALERAA